MTLTADKPKKRFRFNWITFDFMFAGSVGAAVTAACLLLAIPFALSLGGGPIAGILIGAAVVGALVGFGLKQYFMRTKKNVRHAKDPVELNDVSESASESATEIYKKLNSSPHVSFTAETNFTPQNTPLKSALLGDGTMATASRSDAELIREAEFHRSHAPSRRDDAY